jgi:hypothetical protein
VVFYQGKVLIRPPKFFITTTLFSKKLFTNIEMKKSFGGFAGNIFLWCENCMRNYRCVGVATAAGAEALPKPPGASK